MNPKSRLNSDGQGEHVTVTITGRPTAAVTLVRALATVVHVTAIHHHTAGTDPNRIRLHATCHLATHRRRRP